MKIAILGDCHFLVRNGSQIFNDYFEKFFDQIFFPYLKDNNIDTIIGLGDLIDNRKNIDIKGLSECKRYFFDKLSEYNLQMYSLIGNHDIVYRNTLLVNSPSQIFKEYSNLKIIDSPRSLEEFGIDFIPWICKDNESECFDIISNSKNTICVGHFEIKNFSMYKGIECREGLDSKIFSKYEYVFSGHYHHKSNKDNIYYLGTPYELTWMDSEDPRGFHIFDLETRTLEFIENPFKMFNKIFYANVDDFSDFQKYSNSYVKVFVDSIEEGFDEFLDHLNLVNPIKVSIIENAKTLLTEDDHIDESEDTLTIMNSYINNIKNKDIDNERLKMFMDQLYSEANALESTR